jgi:hypothetical protein
MDKIEIIIKAINQINPNSRWKIYGETYEDIEWLEDSEYNPSKEELEEEIQKLKNEWEEKEYQRLRGPEYPSLGDFADAMYWNSKGDSSHLEAYFAACEAVKNKYPKP